MTKKIVAIGEALIDFAPADTGKAIKDTRAFEPNVGGAPANVCGAFVKLGGEALMLTQLGDDPFGDKIYEALRESGIDTSYIVRTTKANTSLAFVALKENGDREFSFYRKPGADMLYQPDAVPREVFDDAYALHFCSVSLGDFPMRDAHDRAIDYAKAAGAIVSFDPNLRKQLWDNQQDLYQAVQDFLPKADIVKISDEEVEFITGHSNIEDALPELFARGITLVIYTMGADGAVAYTENVQAKADGYLVKAVDTTGAGDGFIGSFLNQLAAEDKSIEDIAKLSEEELKRYLRFSNVFCSESVKKHGAISSYATKAEMEQILSGQEK